MNSDNFYITAKKLGHDIEALDRGEEVKSTITFNNIDEVKAFMDGFGGKPAGQNLTDHSNLGTTEKAENQEILNRRVYAYIHDDIPLSQEDRAYVEGAFPVQKEVSSKKDYCVETGMGWIIDNNSPSVINIDTLFLCPKAYIKIINHDVLLNITNVYKNAEVAGSKSCKGAPCKPAPNPTPPPKNYDIAILGITGTTGPLRPAQTGMPNKGGTGINGICAASVVSREATEGGSGLRGYTGNPGLPGMPGMPNLTAKIIITGDIQGTDPLLSVVTRSGTGGKGGQGGAGGMGSAGGAGGHGTLWCTCVISSKPGGNGAIGGRGGTGGTGGNGVPGNNSSISAKSNVLKKINILDTQVVPAGESGGLGIGGTGGKGGVGGPKVGASNTHYPKAHDGVDAGKGPDGPGGQKGKLGGNPGKIRPITLQ